MYAKRVLSEGFTHGGVTCTLEATGDGDFSGLDLIVDDIFRPVSKGTSRGLIPKLNHSVDHAVESHDATPLDVQAAYNVTETLAVFNMTFILTVDVETDHQLPEELVKALIMHTVVAKTFGGAAETIVEILAVRRLKKAMNDHRAEQLSDLLGDQIPSELLERLKKGDIAGIGVVDISLGDLLSFGADSPSDGGLIGSLRRGRRTATRT